MQGVGNGNAGGEVLSKSEQKRRLKLEKIAREKAEKERIKLEKQQQQSLEKDQKQAVAAEEEIVDPTVRAREEMCIEILIRHCAHNCRSGDV